MFSTKESVNLWLGTVTNRPSGLRNRVDRMPISSTTPSTDPIWMRSPTTKGLSMKMAMPPKMLETKSFAAIAMARPPIPTPASSAPTL